MVFDQGRVSQRWEQRAETANHCDSRNPDFVPLSRALPSVLEDSMNVPGTWGTVEGKPFRDEFVRQERQRREPVARILLEPLAGVIAFERADPFHQLEIGLLEVMTDFVQQCEIPSRRERSFIPGHIGLVQFRLRMGGGGEEAQKVSERCVVVHGSPVFPDGLDLVLFPWQIVDDVQLLRPMLPQHSWIGQAVLSERPAFPSGESEYPVDLDVQTGTVCGVGDHHSAFRLLVMLPAAFCNNSLIASSPEPLVLAARVNA